MCPFPALFSLLPPRFSLYVQYLPPKQRFKHESSTDQIVQAMQQHQFIHIIMNRTQQIRDQLPKANVSQNANF